MCSKRTTRHLVEDASERGGFWVKRCKLGWNGESEQLVLYNLRGEEGVAAVNEDVPAAVSEVTHNASAAKETRYQSTFPSGWFISKQFRSRKHSLPATICVMVDAHQ